ncbi:MAG: ATP-binding cassette domain-containing protein [Merdibacter sp.]
MIQKVWRHLKRYNPYSVYAAKSELKSEVSASYLTWIWWILDPVLFMLVYVFITVVVFRTEGEYLPVVVIIGLTVWNFFNKNVSISVKIVNTFKGIVSKIYIPKYMLILEKMYVNFFKMMISFGIVAGFMIAYGIPFRLQLLYCIPLLVLVFILTLACSVIVAHFGVYVNDLYNIVQVILRFMFYLSGVFYDIGDRLGNRIFMGIDIGWLMTHVNPVAYLINEFRQIIIYGEALRPMMFLYWLAFSVVLLGIGLFLMYRHENNYVKWLRHERTCDRGQDVHVRYRSMKSFSLRKSLGQIRQRRDSYEALRGVSFTVPKGKIIGIIGKNGSGKSTLLKTIAGVFSPDEGTIDTFGNRLSLLAIGIGFQTMLSGYENIFLSGLLLGFTEKEIRARLPEIIEFSELGDLSISQCGYSAAFKLAFSITAFLTQRSS